MPLSARQRAVLNAAVAGNIAPRLSQNKKVLDVRTPQGRISLEISGQGLTEAGREYFRRRGIRWRPRTVAGIDYERAVERTSRDGLSKFIVAPDGGKRVTQYFDSQTLRIRTTKVGRQYYANATSPVHAIVPLKGRLKQTGREFETELDYQQATDTREEKRVLRSQDEAQRQAALRQQLIDEGDWDGDTLWLEWIEDSEVEYYWDSAKPFKIRELEVLPQGAVNLRDLPAQAAAPLRYAHLRSVTGICSEAYDSLEDVNCVVHQISAIQRLPRERVEAIVEDSWQRRYGPDSGFDPEASAYVHEFSSRLMSWQERGVTAETILDIARELRVNCRVEYCGQTFIHTPECRDTNRRPPYCSLFGGHCYFYDEASVLRSLAHTPAGKLSSDASRIQLKERKVRTRPFEELVSLDAVEAGKAYLSDIPLQEVREELHAAGVVPKVAMKSVHIIRALSWNGARVLQGDDMTPAVERFCEAAGVPFDGGGIGGALVAAFNRIVRPKRVHIPAKPRREIEERQAGLCQLCEEPGKELDHAVPVVQGGGNECLRLLCEACHSQITADQQLSGSDLRPEFDPVASFMCESTYQALVLDQQPRAFVHNLVEKEPRGGALVYGDTVRCRRNALYHATWDWPVFSVYDQPEEVIGPCPLEPGCWFVDPPRCVSSCTIDPGAANMLHIEEEIRPPLRGKTWYPTNVLAYLLDRGWIRWDHIRWRCLSTGRLPATFFTEPVDQLEAWARAADVSEKLVVNALVGTWNTTRSWRYTLHQSACKAELAHLCSKGYTSWQAIPGGALWEVCEKSEVRRLSSCRPLSDAVLGQESIYLAELIRACQTVPSAVALEINTDGVLAHCHKKHEAALRRALEEPEHLDGSKVYQLKPPEESRLKCGGHRWLPGTEDFVPEERRWEVVDETAEEDVFDQCVEGIIESGGLITGHAGTGKSHSTRRILAELDRRGLTHVETAPTHAGAIQVGGITLHRFCHRKFSGNKIPRVERDFLIVSEVGFCSVVLMSLLAEIRLANPRLRFILEGDFSQFQCPQDSWHGTDITQGNMEDSALLWELAQGRRVHLTQCRRSDPILFELYTKPRPIAELKALLPFKGMARWNLCASHRCRKRLNERRNRRCRELEHICLEADPRFPQSQKTYLAEGVPLVACKTWEGEAITNASMWTVVGLNPLRLESETGKVIEFDPARCQEYFRLAHAMVYQVAQGRTLPGNVCLWEVGSPYFSAKHLLVGLSRATAADLVSVAP